MALLTAPLSISAQSVPALRDRLHTAAGTTALDSEDILPWHLKIEVQLFDPKGQPSEKATIEEWWQNSRTHRIDYILPTHTITDLHNEQGKYYTPGQAPVSYLLETLLGQVVHPMPAEADLNAATPEFRKKSFGKISLDCVMLDRVSKMNGDAHGPLLPAQLPLGIFPTYCFDPGTPSLRVTFNLGSQAVVRNGVGTFQKRSVATNVTIFEGPPRAASGQVVTLRSGEPLPPGIFTAGSDLQPVADPALIPGEVVAKTILKKVAPPYPQSAKDSHISGDVLLHAIIGRDGKIRLLQVISAPDGDLALASLLAVRQWTYKPYLLNGQPTEVDTTITVYFRFG